MSVRQTTQKDRHGRASTFWMIDVLYTHPDGRRERVRRVARIQNRREALREEREIIHALGAGTWQKEKASEAREIPSAAPVVVSMVAGPSSTPAVSTAPLFRDFAKEFLNTYASTNNKPSEVGSKRMILRVHLTPAFGAMRLDEIDIEHVERFKAAKLKKKLAAKTINNHLTVLHRLLAVAREWKKIAHTPPIKWLKAPEPEFDFLTFEEADRLIAHAVPEWRTMIVLAVRTGMRLGELLALRWEDVDLQNGRLVVRRSVAQGVVGTPKSGRKREIPLSQQALETLQAHREASPGALVFSRERGAMLDKAKTKWPLWTSCKRAGLRRIGWHVLRHTFASHLAMRGAPLKAVQELLGHATMEMTMRYAHLSPDARRDVVRLLDGEAPGGHGKTVAKQTGEGGEE